MEDKKLVIGIRERPSPGKWIALSFQHVFAMFGATVLVPILTGLPVGTALFTSGIGTLIYILLTKGQSPMYLGSSFAFIAPIIAAMSMNGGTAENPNLAAVCTGIMGAGLVYVVFAVLVKLAGTNWLDKLLPPVVVGPMIMVIGLGLAGTACAQAGLVPADDVDPTSPARWQVIVIALIAMLVTALVAVYAKGFFKIVPIITGIFAGYLAAVVIDLTLNRTTGTPTLVMGGLSLVANDFRNVSESGLGSIFGLPTLFLPFGERLGTTANGAIHFYSLDFVAFISIMPVALVAMAEHIGDHKVLSTIIGKDLTKEPGLHRTLAGDGIATFVAGMLGGPANTSYGENTGVIGMTKVGSVFVTGGAAVIAILLSFVRPFQHLVQSIPSGVMGGICIILFGFIAANGLRVMVDAKVDFNQTRNVIVASVMLVLGLGGAVLSFAVGNASISVSGMALAAIAGIIMNLILPKAKSAA